MILTVTLNAAIDKTYTVNNFNINHVHRTTGISALPGGKGINVARILSTLGIETLATGFVGGYSGKFILDELEKQNLNNDFLQIQGESRTCINILDCRNATSTEILENGISISESDQKAFFTKFKNLCQKSKVVVMSGSVPNGLSTDVYRKLTEIANANGAVTILDTNKDYLIEGIKGKPYMIKPNNEELGAAFGIKLNDEKDIEKVIEMCLKDGISTVVVSLGKKGSIVGSEKGFFRVCPPEIKAVNPVGCGDALVAGFAAGFSKGLDIKDTIKLATATATSNALHYGAGMVDKKEVEDFMNGIEIYDFQNA